MKPKDTSQHFILSSSPHTHAKSSVSGIMLDVIIALLPTTAAGIWVAAGIGMAVACGLYGLAVSAAAMVFS